MFTPARALAKVLGSGDAFILLLQLFMAITSTGNTEIIAVSPILTYDIYYKYLDPDLRHLLHISSTQTTIEIDPHMDGTDFNQSFA